VVLKTSNLDMGVEKTTDPCECQIRASQSTCSSKWRKYR